MSSACEKRTVLRLWLAALCILLAASMFAGFGAKRVPYGGVVRAALQYEVKTLDPVNAANPTELQISSLIFDRLVTYDAKGEIKPALAAEWSVNADATQWDFSLQKNARFHDGAPITSADVKNSFERLIRTPQNPIGQYLSRRIRGAADYAGGSRSDISGLLVRNPQQLTILTTAPQPGLADLLTLLPCSVLKVGGGGAGRAFSLFVGSGPFMPAPGGEKSRLVLRGFSNYFAGPPYLERIEISSRRSIRQPSALFRVGKLDLLELAAADRVPIERDSQGTGTTSSRATTLLLGVNSQSAPFKRVEARDAVCRMIDRNIILRVLLKSDGQLATGLLPPDIADFSALREKPLYQPDLAGRLFSPEGTSPGETAITIITRNADDYAQPIAQRIAVNLRDLGLRALIEPLAPEDFNIRLQNRKFDLFLDSFSPPSPDAGLDLYVFLATYAALMTPERVAEARALLSRADAMNLYDDRTRQFYMAERQLLEDYTVIPIFHLKGSLMVSTHLANVWVDILGNIRLEDAWRKDER